MPTLQEWEQALTIPRRVRVESSPRLIQQVERRLLRRESERQRQGRQIAPRKNTLSGVPFFAPQRELDIVPLYLLQRLGVVTTPAVENLADICSWWAYFRYLWAFEIPSPGATGSPLRLSEAARNIDFHQKGLLSDQIGVGIAAVLLGDYLSAPFAADVSVAMNDPLWPIDLQFGASPDYLFFDNSQTNIFIVECKGTQTTRSASLDQLCRGTEQVPSLVFTDGRTPASLIVATLLSDNETSVFVVDPPGDEDFPSEHHEKPERLDQRRWKVRNDKEFARATGLISQAKLLSYAGADEAAAEKLERARALPEGGRRAAARKTETSENEFGTFIGVRESVGVKDRVNVEVFQALDRVVYDAILSEESGRLTEEIRSFQERTALPSLGIEPTQRVIASHGADSVVVRSAGPDGSLLEVRVSAP